MQHIQAIVDTNIIGTLYKIALLEWRRFKERPNSLYYYYNKTSCLWDSWWTLCKLS